MTLQFKPHINYCELGWIAAAFKDACKQLDAKLWDTQRAALRKAWTSILNNDLAQRDALCDWMKDAPRSATDAKIEIWYRICESRGLTRSQADGYTLELQELGGFDWELPQ